ncbi:hypothetical protein RYX36_034912, partial [Vicia faba]
MKVSEKFRNHIGVLLSGEKNLKASKSFNDERERSNNQSSGTFRYVLRRNLR